MEYIKESLYDANTKDVIRQIKKAEINKKLNECPEYGDDENIFIEELQKLVGFTMKDEKYSEYKGVSINFVFKDREAQLDSLRNELLTQLAILVKQLKYIPTQRELCDLELKQRLDKHEE